MDKLATTTHKTRVYGSRCIYTAWGYKPTNIPGVDHLAKHVVEALSIGNIPSYMNRIALGVHPRMVVGGFNWLYVPT